MANNEAGNKAVKKTQWWRWALGPLLATIIWLSPLNLEFEAHALAGLVSWVVLWWVFEPIPLAATGFLGVAFTVILGISGVKAAFAPFAHPLVFLFAGGFMIARAMSVHGLDKRIALFILTRKAIEGRPWRILVALLCVTAFLSMWISNTATTAMLLPISMGVLAAILPKEDRAQGTVLIAVAYAASIGGIATPVGSTPNIISIGLLESAAGIRFTFFDWMSVALPIMLVCLGFLIFVLSRRLPTLPKKIKSSYLKDEYKSLGNLNRGELNTTGAALTAVALWITPGMVALYLGAKHPHITWLKSHFPEAVSAVVAASLLFILPLKNRKPTLTWKQATEIDWGSLILFGGGISLGSMMFKTGLAKVLGETLILSTGGSFMLFIIACVLFAIFFTETTSNTATANMLLPLVIAASQTSGYNPLLPTLGVAFACSLAFMMPVSTPPNAIVYGSGKIKISQMISNGWIMNLGCAVILLVAIGLMFAAGKGN